MDIVKRGEWLKGTVERVSGVIREEKEHNLFLLRGSVVPVDAGSHPSLRAGGVKHGCMRL